MSRGQQLRRRTRPAAETPLAVTQVEYDEARGPAGFPHSKRAFRIAGQLGTSWKESLETAHLTGRSFSQKVAALKAGPLTDLTEEGATAALRAIALRGGVAALRPHEYDRELARLTLELGRAWLHGRERISFPSAAQIETQIGWDRALKCAGLDPRTAQSARTPAAYNAPLTWTLERCVKGVDQLLDELARHQPGATLTQDVYQSLAAGRRDLPAMSRVAAVARKHGTTFTAIRDELIEWRIIGGTGEPPIFEWARQLDAQPPDTSAKDARSEAHLQARVSEPWAAEVLSHLDEIGEPTAIGTLIPRLGWPRNTLSKRLLLLERAALIKRINLGRGKKTTRWLRSDQGT